MNDALNGTVSLDTNGDVLFIPTTGFSGIASFNYTVSDGIDTDIGFVTVDVISTNNAPIAVDDTVTAAKNTAKTILAANLLANDTDADGDTLTLTTVSNAINGTVSLDGNGDVVFTPTTGFSGMASFDYTVSHGTDTYFIRF